MAKWADDKVLEVETGRTWRVLERYLLPGKDTGFVLVCSERACFTEIRGHRFPLGRLPHDISPEDRSAVVGWGKEQFNEQINECWKAVIEGIPPPKRLDDCNGKVI